MNFSEHLLRKRKKIKPLQTVVLPTNHVSRCNLCLFKMYFKHDIGHFVHYEQRRLLTFICIFKVYRKKEKNIYIYILSVLSIGIPHINCLFSH